MYLFGTWRSWCSPIVNISFDVKGIKSIVMSWKALLIWFASIARSPPLSIFAIPCRLSWPFFKPTISFMFCHHFLGFVFFTSAIVALTWVYFNFFLFTLFLNLLNSKVLCAWMWYCLMLMVSWNSSVTQVQSFEWCLTTLVGRYSLLSSFNTDSNTYICELFWNLSSFPSLTLMQRKYVTLNFLIHVTYNL